MTDAGSTFDVRLVAIRYETHDVRLLELARPDGTPLPPSSPGAHVDLHLAPELVRQYSLLATGTNLCTWEVAVKLVSNGRGGSAAVHERLRVGEMMQVSPPRNAFTLVPDAAFSVLIGGGIGITPLLAMAKELARIGAAFDFHVAHRSRASAALAARLPATARLHLREEADRRLDVAAIVRNAPVGAHLYCCGPAAMIADFEQAAVGCPATHVHVERFAAEAVADAGSNGSFQVDARRSGRRITVDPDRTVLQALRQAGIAAVSSCEQGICGACEVTVIEGRPDHRDGVLSEAERATSKSMMICCSRSLSPMIALDI